MSLTSESIDNFLRGSIGDSFLGVVIHDPASGSFTTHLALAEGLDGSAIPQSRFSRVGGVIRDPLPGAGGHARLVGFAGAQAQQVARGQATGNAIGFSLIKTGANGIRIGTFRSGFNSQFPGRRPGFAEGTASQARTLPEINISQLLHELTGGIMGGRARSQSL